MANQHCLIFLISGLATYSSRIKIQVHGHLLDSSIHSESSQSIQTQKTSIATFISKHEIYLLLVTTQAYCVKCKSKRDMKNEKQVTMKNGRRAVSGTCSVCGTKMFRIGGGGGTSSRTASVAVAKQRPKVKVASRKPTSKTAKTRKSKTKGKRWN